ncbi:MAG: isochorismatase family protein, partial [Candidatus Eremiobacteraeota bacterium]|nr:isochorismatase family protein [Candidatus Eremiobacteraeota bacterium]
GARWNDRNNLAFETNVTALIEAFRTAKQPVAYFLHSDSDEHFNVGSPFYRLMSFLAPRPGEAIFHKTTYNCFTSTALLPALLRAGVDRVTITGIRTEQCCETTTRVACDLGFEVDFVSEATLTFPIAKPSGAELSGDEVLERTELVLRDRFARIVTVAEVVARLQGGVAVPIVSMC